MFALALPQLEETSVFLCSISLSQIGKRLYYFFFYIPSLYTHLALNEFSETLKSYGTMPKGILEVSISLHHQIWLGTLIALHSHLEEMFVIISHLYHSFLIIPHLFIPLIHFILILITVLYNRRFPEQNKKWIIMRNA